MEQGRNTVTNKYNQDLEEYKLRMTKEFKERIIHKAKELRKEAEELKVFYLQCRSSKKKRGREEKKIDSNGKNKRWKTPSSLEEATFQLQD
jgi:hypothetical protein